MVGVGGSQLIFNRIPCHASVPCPLTKIRMLCHYSKTGKSNSAEIILTLVLFVVHVLGCEFWHNIYKPLGIQSFRDSSDKVLVKFCFSYSTESSLKHKLFLYELCFQGCTSHVYLYRSPCGSMNRIPHCGFSVYHF